MNEGKNTNNNTSIVNERTSGENNSSGNVTGTTDKTDNGSGNSSQGNSDNTGDSGKADEGNTGSENEVDTPVVEEPPAYDYGKRVPLSEPVGDEYFDDAVFIGNSQTEGILIYGQMKNATVYAGKGIMVDTIYTKDVVKNTDGTRMTIMKGLEINKFGKVYIMLGANELGWPDESFIKHYAKVIDDIKALQPEAKIYINLIMPMAKSKSDNDKIYNNTNINRFNDMIKAMAKEKQVYFIDSREAVADENGYLPEDAGTDGVHLGTEYYKKWFEYLKKHTVPDLAAENVVENNDGE